MIKNEDRMQSHTMELPRRIPILTRLKVEKISKFIKSLQKTFEFLYG